MKRIDEVNDLSAIDFDHKYYQRGQPIIHRGGVKDSIYYQKWSFDYLKSTFESRVVEVAHAKKGYYKFDNKEDFAIKYMPMSEAIDYFASKEHGKFHYLQQTSIPDVFPELKSEIDQPPWMLDNDLLMKQNLWVGGSGCVSPLHYDASPNFLVQLRGRKKLIIYSVDDSKYLYAGQGKETAHLSEVNLSDVDHERFPLYQHAQRYECILEPGDLLFIPPGWWHEVSSIDASISVNFWFLRFDIVEGLEHASVDDLRQKIQFFIDAGLNINSQDSEGEFLLIKAIAKRYANVVEALIQSGADPNCISQKIRKGTDALTLAMETNQMNTVDLLKNAGIVKA